MNFSELFETDATTDENTTGTPAATTDAGPAGEAAQLAASSCYGTVDGVEAQCGSGTAHGPH